MKAMIQDSTVVFQAFADPTRLRLLNLLIDRELCVCDLCSLLRVEQPKISRHLAYLRRAGLVSVRVAGKWKYYRVARGVAGLRKNLLRCVKSCLREVNPLSADLAKLADYDCSDCN